MITRQQLEEVLYALEYASDMTKPEGLSGCDCPICTQIKVVRDVLKERQHVTDGTKCWCEPVLDYVDPVTGAEVWVHREPQ